MSDASPHGSPRPRARPAAARVAAADGGGRSGPPAARLPLLVKLAYGAPAFAGAAMGLPIAILMPRFYSDVVLAPLGTIALMIAVARAFDALTDPVMGWLSDRTQTRFGRRKPWIAVGTPCAAVAFWLLFSPPPTLGGPAAALWFGATFAAFFLFQTIEGVPMAALGAELTSDYNERSSLFGIRSYFIAAGIIVASVAPALVTALPGIASERDAYSAMAATYAGVWVVLVGLQLLGVRERPEFVRRPANPLVPGVRRALRNRPFRILLFAGIVGAVPAAVPALLIPYFVRYVLAPADPTTVVAALLSVYFVTGLVCVPIWVAVARRAGKLRAFLAASTIGVLTSLLYVFAGPGDVWFTAGLAFVQGTQAMAGSFLVPAMAADVIDYDELHTGRRREAQYSAFWSIIPKLIAIPGSSVPLAALAAVGYVPNQVQTEEVRLTIRLLYSVFPAAFYVASLAIMRRYPISEAAHRAILEGLARHARGERARDPLTGAIVPPPRTGAPHPDDGWFLDFFSAGELRAVLARGPRVALPRVLASAGAALAVAVAAVALASAGMGSLAEEPHPATVFAVVAAGLAASAFGFHALRIAPARRIRHAPPAPDAIRAHLVMVGADPPPRTA